jgi:hypothetical protein
MRKTRSKSSEKSIYTELDILKLLIEDKDFKMEEFQLNVVIDWLKSRTK